MQGTVSHFGNKQLGTWSIAFKTRAPINAITGVCLMNWLIAGMPYQIIEIYFMYCCRSKQRRNSNSHRWPLPLNTVQASKKVSSAAVDFPPVIKPTLTIVQRGLFVHLLYLSCCWKIFVGRVVIAFLYSDSLLISVFLWEVSTFVGWSHHQNTAEWQKQTQVESLVGEDIDKVLWDEMDTFLEVRSKLDNIWMQMSVKIDVPVRTFKWCMKLSNVNRSMEALYSSLMIVVGWTSMEKA